MAASGRNVMTPKILRALPALMPAAALAALVLLSSAALAQDKKVRMQMAGAYPSAMPSLGQGQLYTADRIRKLSAGSVEMRFFEAGALIPGSQYLDAIGAGTLDSAWTSLGFFTGKEIALTLYNTVPFGPDLGEYLAWMRFFGLGANVMQKMGVQTQNLQPGEIFQALQLGTIDATEFSMPAMDLTLGFHQVAKHYYFPGWHQQATLTHLLISKQKWAELSETQKEIVKAACDQTMLQLYAEGEGIQFKALKDIQAKGVTLHSWPKEIMDAYRKAWSEVVEEQSTKSPDFKKG